MDPGSFEFESFRFLEARGYRPERLDAAALARRYPAWNAERYPDGYVSPRGGWAESGAVVARLLERCDTEGVRRVTGTFGRLVSTGSRVSGVELTDGRAIDAGHVVVSAGAWTPMLLPWLSGLLRPVAQPVIHFGVENPSDFRSPRFLPYAADIAGSGWYGFPALEDGRLKLGHHGDGRIVEPSHRGEVADDHLSRARRFLAESIPSLAAAPVVGTRVCLYCDSVDGDLLIDRDPEREGLVVASGGSGHGFKFAPVIGGIVADALEGRENRWSRRFRWRTDGERKTEEARLTESGPKSVKPTQNAEN
jgi:glycine/D-amino acid oxidase-like deaminating enzyme